MSARLLQLPKSKSLRLRGTIASYFHPLINFQRSFQHFHRLTCRVAASLLLPTTRPCFKKNHSPKRKSALHLGAPRPYSRQFKKKILLEPLWLEGKDATPNLFPLSNLLFPDPP